MFPSSTGQPNILGHFVDIERPFLDPDHVTVINIGQTFQVQGLIEKWTYRATNMNSFKACVWRLAKEDTYKLIGCSLIKPDVPNDAMEFIIPDEEMIPVQEGDMIGFTFPASSPLSYSSLNDDSDDFIMFHNRIDGNYETLVPGDCLEAIKSVAKRSYSVYATLQSESIVYQLSVIHRF